jgi:hypothetical protein
MCIHYKESDLLNLNLSYDDILSNCCALRKEPEIMVFWTKESQTNDAVKFPRLVILMCSLSDANLMVPIWKRKWGRLLNVDGKHSSPLSPTTFKNDTARKPSNQLESKY